MARRVPMLALAALLAAAAGCRAPCGERRGLFTSWHRDAPGRVVGRAADCEVCPDGVPVSGAVIGPGSPGVLVPGGTVIPGPAGRPDELPYPQPSDLIPRPGQPFAPPSVAPPGNGPVGTLPAPKEGVPVKGTK